MQRYNPQEIESKWQGIWEESGTYTANLTSDRPKYFALSMFNYPSGAGIHIGHAMNYTISDVKARFKRQQGFESYHPVGWDAFGLPAENFAIKSGISPQQSMAKIIPSYHKQYKAMGWSNDWEKEIATHLPEYYKWTQWIFAKMYQHGLAYQDARMQWWCDKCQTVLANEQVIDGKCWRHDAADDPEVQKREVKQWFFKITEYAEELLQAIDGLDWSDSVKLAQKNWIGRSEGAYVDFAIEGSNQKLKVFTTRPETLFGATFLVVAPEHPLIAACTTTEQKPAVEAYVRAAQAKTEVQRQEANGEKTGVFTGAYVTNPINDEKIPVWTADYVLAGYGTGAIMAVPAHDERDHAFAQQFDLPIRTVIAEEFGVPAENETRVDGSTVVVYDRATKKYLGLDWGKGFIGLIAGGIEKGESYLDCATRELQEEGGISGVTLQQLGSKFYTHYYHGTKKTNRFASAVPFIAIVDTPEMAEPQRETHETFTRGWFDADEIVAAMRNFDGTGHWQQVLRQAEEYVQAIEAGETNPQIITTDMVHEGVLVNSGEYSELATATAREKITVWLSEKGVGASHINYKMRDWSVSRQRYWGAPIPIIHCAKCGPVLVAEKELPVVLPELDDFQPSGDGRSALARAKDWLQVDCPKCGGQAERETDTLDTYICSSWYMFRYLDPHNQQAIFDSEIAKKWEPVDFYNGADHATAHLLYARFVARFFTKLGLINNPEPFKQFLFNGKVTAADGQMFSKSKGNGVDPLEIINQGYGADSLRTYLMFASPLELWTKWNPQGVPGAYRFLSRVWTLTQEYLATDIIELNDAHATALARASHPAIKKITEDIEANRYNTAIATAMSWVNDLYKLKMTEFGQSAQWQSALESLVACIAPFAPHMSDELWHQLGHSSSVHRDSWPKFDAAYLVSEEATIVVQINGKMRASLTCAKDASQQDVVAAAQANEKIQPLLADATIARTIFVPNKLVNFVVK